MSAESPSWQSAALPAIPGYTILSELGRGGMGVVYHARRATDGSHVALKLALSGRTDNAASLARFRIEAEAIACLQHPNIIRMHEVGVYGGCPMVALEFAEGGSLGSIGRRPQYWSAWVVKCVAEAIQVAHDRGILHRDLKPANVLLMGDGTPKVTDFGLAKFERPAVEVRRQFATMQVTPEMELEWMRAEYQSLSWFSRLRKSFNAYVADSMWSRMHGHDCPRKPTPAVKKFLEEASRQVSLPPPPELVPLLNGLTAAGDVMGTPQYMSPEQAIGRGVGPASDIYALGALLYSLLTGHPPFQGSSVAEVLHKVCNDPPIPIGAEVDSGLAAICMKCMAKDPQVRYKQPGAVANDLASLLAREAVEPSQWFSDLPSGENTGPWPETDLPQ